MKHERLSSCASPSRSCSLKVTAGIDSPIELNPVGAYIVSFAAGVVIGGAKDTNRLVRAVREGLAP